MSIRPSIKIHTLVILFLSTAIILSPSTAQSSLNDLERKDAEISRRQSQKDRAKQLLSRQQAPNVHMEVNSENAALGNLTIPSNESPCFIINQVELKTHSDNINKKIESTDRKLENFNWALKSIQYPNKTIIGQCLGSQGISITMQRIQNAIIEKGYVTTRVVAEPQDLNQKKLTLVVIPGRLGKIILTDSAKGKFKPFTALPNVKGALLNLRDIEQGLENLQRTPSAEADIQIVPSEAPNASNGQSDLLVDFKEKRRVRLSFSTDDTGSTDTGKMQGGATLSIDNPFKLNDLFYISANHDLGGGNKEIRHKGTRGFSGHYSVPFGYWTLGLTASAFRYYQVIVGEEEDYKYKGTSKSGEITLSHILHRDQISKTTALIGAWLRTSRNFIEDTEVEVQRRRMAGFTLGLSHQRQIKNLSLEANITFKRGTGAMKTISAPEEEFGEGTSRFRLLRANISWQLPFTIKQLDLKYSGSFDAQWNRSRLVPLDFYAIGGRYSVRGFDGEMSLSGERGITLRNELSLSLSKFGQEIYAAIDVGRVSGPATEYLNGKVLVGSALGLRGTFKGLNYEGFLGMPLKKPKEFKTKQPTFGFNLSYQF